VSSEVRCLGAGDEALLFAFLEQHLDSSLFLLSNAERGGLVDRGEQFQGTYAAHLEEGVVTAVASHAFSGNVLVQGELGLAEAARLATKTSGRPVKGIIGPLALVYGTRSALGLDDAPVARALDDRLFVLELERLRVPALLGAAGIEFRSPTDSEVTSVLVAWRAAYHAEVLGALPSPELQARALGEMESLHRAKRCWVLARSGVPVALTGFNATTHGVVQVGGVYTPPELRKNGYARSALAGSLLLAREQGYTRSTLFTSVDNAGAVRAYTALGYEAVGDFALLLFR
jgi:uncharacterized protein